MRRYLESLATIFLTVTLALGPLAAAPSMPEGARPNPPPPAIAAIAKKLTGGFYEIPGASIAAVFPSSDQLKDGYGVLGPRAVITAWNGAAFDPARLEWYFHGGGHTDYGGNEVYRFSFVNLRWSRLTEPARYPNRSHDPSAPLEARCPYPLAGPPSTHTYDGTFFSPLTGTLFVFGDIAFCPSGRGLRWTNGGYEFNPSESEARNGLSPLTWRWRPEISAPKGLKHTAVLPGGNILIGGGESDALLDPRSGEISAHNGQSGNAGDGASVSDRRRHCIWLINHAGLSRIDYKNGNLSGRQKIASIPLPYGVIPASGIAVHEPTGKLVFWSGSPQVVTFDPDNEKWQKFDYPAASAPAARSDNNYIFSKWVYLADFDVFAGYNDPRKGVILFKLPQ